MKASKILNEQIKNLKVASLPSRPTAPTSFGGRGYTANQVKEAFDALPLFIVEKFNALIADILDVGEDSMIASVKTGIRDGHTLLDLIDDIRGGELAEYLSVGDGTLDTFRTEYDEDISEIEEDIESIYGVLNEKTIDCGSPADRKE